MTHQVTVWSKFDHCTFLLPPAPAALLFKSKVARHGDSHIEHWHSETETEAGRLPWIQGQMRIHEFQVSLGYRIRTCLKGWPGPTAYYLTVNKIKETMSLVTLH